jgi:hypothetical protein
VVQFGLLFWDAAQGGQALRLIRDVIADLPRSLNAETAALTAPPEPFVPPEHHHKPGYALLLAGFGDQAEHRHGLTASATGCHHCSNLSAQCPTSRCNKMLDEANAWGFYGYEKGAYFDGLSDDMIDILTQQMPKKPPRCQWCCSTASTRPTARSARTTPRSAVDAAPDTWPSSSDYAPHPTCCLPNAHGCAQPGMR